MLIMSTSRSRKIKFKGTLNDNNYVKEKSRKVLVSKSAEKY